MPTFYKGENLHHYRSQGSIIKIQHPDCNVIQEHLNGNRVAGVTSLSVVGRLLIILMSLNKWHNKVPEYNSPSHYKQEGEFLGEQIECLSITIRDTVLNDDNWLVDSDIIFDVLDYWKDVTAVTTFIEECNLTPIVDKVAVFQSKVIETNSEYYRTISKCESIACNVISGVQLPIQLTFFETCLCYVIISSTLKSNHLHTKLLTTLPTDTTDLMRVFE